MNLQFSVAKFQAALLLQGDVVVEKVNSIADRFTVGLEPHGSPGVLAHSFVSAMNAFHEKPIDVAVTGRNDTSRVNAAVAMLNRGRGQSIVYVEYTGLRCCLHPAHATRLRRNYRARSGSLRQKGISEAESLAATGDQQKN